jgi:TRAP-type C4-dicarboxylate transport system permease large subunit
MAFSQNLAMSGASQGLIEFATSLPLTPIFIFIAMQFIVLVMGMFMEPGSILMVAIPLFLPIVYALGFDPAWFAVVLLLNIEMAVTSPPFGLVLFVMKGVAPPDTTIGDVIKAGFPFLLCDATAMILCILFPILPLWLPGLM